MQTIRLRFNKAPSDSSPPPPAIAFTYLHLVFQIFSDLSCGEVPDLNEAVDGSRDEILTVRRKARALHVRLLTKLSKGTKSNMRQDILVLSTKPIRAHASMVSTESSEIAVWPTTWSDTRKLACLYTFMVLLSWVGYFSSSCSRTAALPLNTSIVVPAKNNTNIPTIEYIKSDPCNKHSILRNAHPLSESQITESSSPGGSNPWCCCHFSAWPSRASRREGGTTFTSPARAWAIAARRRSFVWPSAYA